MVLPPFVSELGALSSTIERGVRDIGATVAGGPFGLTEAQVDRSIDRAIETLRGAGGTVAKGVLTGAVLLTQWATATLLTIFLTFFFVKDGPALWRWVIELFARNRQPHIHALGLGAWSVLTAYVQGAALVATIDAVLIGILLVVVGVPLAVPLVTLTFLAAFFPIVGAFVAGAAAVLVALVANGPVAAGIVLAGVVVIQQLEGNVFYPVVVGRRLALHPVAMLAALTAGGLLGGIAGAFLATPLAAVIGSVIAYSRSDQRLLNASGAAPASQLRPS
jgi:predicted PurR-regulated permease PerM